MIVSMTGFGRSEADSNGLSICIEIKSVNRRYLELHQKLSKGYNYLEEKISSYIKDRIKRGKVDIFVEISNTRSDSCNICVDDVLLASYVDAFKKVSEKYKLDGSVDLSLLSSIDGIFVPNRLKLDEELVWNNVEPVLKEALRKMTEMRKVEGNNISEDLNLKARRISSALSKLEPLCFASVQRYKDRLAKRIEELIGSTSVDEQRLATEVAIFADKSDISEEIVRLRSHLEQFFILLDLSEPVGRKLDFLLQEMNREINTIGSKSSSVDISNIVVDVKAELEKIREQVQNIE